MNWPNSDSSSSPTGFSSDTGACAERLIESTSSGSIPVTSAISSGVGSRPRSVTSLRSAPPGRPDEAQRALLDQVEERQPLIAVVLRDRDDQPQVGLDHLLLRVEVAALDPAREVDLLLGGEQADLADVLQEQLKGVGGHVRR